MSFHRNVAAAQEFLPSVATETGPPIPLQPEGHMPAIVADFGLKAELLSLRRQPGYGMITLEDEQNGRKVSDNIRALRTADVPGLGAVPITDFVKLMQSDPISPGVKDSAFSIIYDKFHKPLSLFLGSTTLLSHHDLIPDTVQDSLIKVRSKIDMYKPRHQDSFAAWVLTLTTFCSVDMLRKNKRTTNFSDIWGDYEDHGFPEDRLMPFTGTSHIGADPYKVIEIKETLGAIRNLPSDQRNALGARILGFNPSEIANMLGKSESSVHGLVHRARRQYKTMLSTEPAQPSPFVNSERVGEAA